MKRVLLLALCAAAAGAGIVVISEVTDPRWVAAGHARSSNGDRKTSGFENYDIRLDRGDLAHAARLRFRAESGRTEQTLATRHNEIKDTERRLRSTRPGIDIEYGETQLSPEVISPGGAGGEKWLTPKSNIGHDAVLKKYIRDHADLFGLNDVEIDSLVVSAKDDGDRRDRKLSIVELQQFIDGVPMFQGHVKAGFTRDGEIVRVINNLASGISAIRHSDSDFGDAASWVRPRSSTSPWSTACFARRGACFSGKRPTPIT